MNILLLTSVYPQPDDTNVVTPVVHYFARSWVEMGHKVVVIHNANKFARAAYYLPDSITAFLHTRLAVNIPNIRQRTEVNHVVDGVKVYRLPIFKLIPFFGFSKKNINKQFRKISTILDQNGFAPDLIIGHWENPQVPLVAMLKRHLGGRSAIICHGTSYLTSKKWKKEYVPHIDLWGARSRVLAQSIAGVLRLSKMPFICYSGIPDESILPTVEKSFKSNELTSFVYVGQLYRRKFVDVIIKSLVSHSKKFTLDIVGDGVELNNLAKIVKQYDASKNVRFLGRQSRSEVLALLLEKECFIMISENEVFGLAYLEAMSRKCLVIASRDEGMDGIIKHMENGFLCEAGNTEKLSELIDMVRQMPASEKNRIAENAYITANGFTDSKVAEDYLNHLNI